MPTKQHLKDYGVSSPVARRYDIAIYVILLLAGVVSGFVAIVISPRREVWPDILLNLGASFFSAATIFFLLRVFLLDQDRDVRREISKLLERLSENRRVPFLARQVQGIAEVARHLEHASVVSMSGYTLNRIIDDGEDSLYRAVAGGATLRILVVGPETQAVELIKANSQSPLTTHNVSRSLSLLRNFNERCIAAGLDRRLEVRTIDWIPSCSIYKIGSRRPSMDWMQVEIYPPAYSTSSGRRPVFQLERATDSEWYGFFEEQFETLWVAGRAWSLTD